MKLVKNRLGLIKLNKKRYVIFVAICDLAPWETDVKLCIKFNKIQTKGIYLYKTNDPHVYNHNVYIAPKMKQKPEQA